MIFKAIGLCKMCRNGPSHHVASNGVEEFNAKNVFNNHPLEMSMVLINQQRWHCIKFGYCYESLHVTWTKCKKGDSEMTSPRILGKSKNSL